MPMIAMVTASERAKCLTIVTGWQGYYDSCLSPSVATALRYQEQIVFRTSSPVTQYTSSKTALFWRPVPVGAKKFPVKCPSHLEFSEILNTNSQNVSSFAAIIQYCIIIIIIIIIRQSLKLGHRPIRLISCAFETVQDLSVLCRTPNRTQPPLVSYINNR